MKREKSFIKWAVDETEEGRILIGSIWLGFHFKSLIVFLAVLLIASKIVSEIKKSRPNTPPESVEGGV